MSEQRKNQGMEEQPVRLRRLLIHRYRNVRHETELWFDDEWNLLLGKNGTGKTTLLRLLEAVLSGDLERLGKNALDVEYDVECGPARISGRIEWYCGVWNPPADGAYSPSLLPFDLRVAGTMLLEGAPTVSWQYATPGDAFNVWLGEEALPFRSGTGVVSYASPYPGGARVALGRETSHGPPRLALQRELVQLGWLVDACRLDESLDYFSSLLGVCGRLVIPKNANRTASLSRSMGTMRRHDRSLWAGVLSADPQRLRARGALVTSSDNDAVLADFETLSGLRKVEFEVPLVGIDVTAEETTFRLGDSRLRASIPNGTMFFHEDFSFGQKRLFSLLSYLEGTPIVLADELTNGLHRDWLDAAVKKIRGRQSFVAAQNPLLLDRIGFENGAQMRRSFVFCREENGEFVWVNASEDDAHDVFRAYEVGLQNVSEILWQKGLW
jgi:energy-coupling factor transporter ATP-binding protein EcfA2